MPRSPAVLRPKCPSKLIITSSAWVLANGPFQLARPAYAQLAMKLARRELSHSAHRPALAHDQPSGEVAARSQHASCKSVEQTHGIILMIPCPETQPPMRLGCAGLGAGALRISHQYLWTNVRRCPGRCRACWRRGRAMSKSSLTPSWSSPSVRRSWTAPSPWCVLIFFCNVCLMEAHSYSCTCNPQRLKADTVACPYPSCDTYVPHWVRGKHNAGYHLPQTRQGLPHYACMPAMLASAEVSHLVCRCGPSVIYIARPSPAWLRRLMQLECRPSGKLSTH